MRSAIRKVVPPCLGSSFAVSIVQLLRHMGVWTVGDFAVNLSSLF